MRWLSALASLSFATFGYAVVGPGAVTGNTAVHDPTMCKDNSGKYFVFCKPLVCKIFCNSDWVLLKATAVGIEIRTSTDRTAWTLIGKVWPNGASWTDQYTGTSNGWVWTQFPGTVRNLPRWIVIFGHQIVPLSTGNSSWVVRYFLLSHLLIHLPALLCRIQLWVSECSL